MNKKIICLIAAAVLMLCFTACTKSVNNNVTDNATVTENRENITDMQKVNLSGKVPDELEYIPDGYENPARGDHDSHVLYPALHQNHRHRSRISPHG